MVKITSFHCELVLVLVTRNRAVDLHPKYAVGGAQNHFCFHCQLEIFIREAFTGKIFVD